MSMMRAFECAQQLYRHKQIFVSNLNKKAAQLQREMLRNIIAFNVYSCAYI